MYGWSQIAYEDDDETSEDRKDFKRKTFQKNLEKNGLQLELEPAAVCIFFFLFYRTNFMLFIYVRKADLTVNAN